MMDFSGSKAKKRGRRSALYISFIFAKIGGKVVNKKLR
ncbi:hypothetical protein JCM19302_823 [Jejuia pallidilutea]|uniref:Uncharacterized protein n=1 Tax=Jejuia pallidilutea TaxID=504487 RepID=A0A090W177_9FLAO|nr:hypothetical protein JCM19302_823 [Jejuia pallidilutea]